jgi:hypothetical protein
MRTTGGTDSAGGSGFGWGASRGWSDGHGRGAVDYDGHTASFGLSTDSDLVVEIGLVVRG